MPLSKPKNQIIFSNYLYFEYISKWIQDYCLEYAKQVKLQKQTKNNLPFNSCKFLCVIFLVLFYIFTVISLSILQLDAIFVLSGTKNDITGQKTISRDISFLCHHVITQIKAQVCGNKSSSWVSILKSKLYLFYKNKQSSSFEIDRPRTWRTMCSKCRSLQISCRSWINCYMS